MLARSASPVVTLGESTLARSNGLLQCFHFAAGELHAAEFVHAQGQIVERRHGAAHAAGAAEHVEHADDLPTHNDKVERP